MSKSKPEAAPRPAPRLMLLTPEVADAAAFARVLEPVLAAADIAALVLRLADADERTLVNRIKALAPAIQERGVALLIAGRADIVARGGADGAHLADYETFATALDALKPERIAGCGGLASRHDAMQAAEDDADYVMFGEPDRAGHRPSFAAIVERVEWWAEVFQVPCVAWAGEAAEVGPLAAAGADFVALGDWIWSDPQGAVEAVAAAGRALAAVEPTA